MSLCALPDISGYFFAPYKNFRRDIMKKSIAVAAAAMLLSCSAMGFSAYAAESDSVNVGVSVVDNKGQIVLADEIIKVTDVDSDGKLTINDAFIIAHEEKFEGGKDGFATEEGQYGLQIVKFWGIENSGSYSYTNNDKFSNGLLDPVADGDNLVGYIYTDAKKYDDLYSYFDKKSVEAEKGDEIELTLTYITFGADYSEKRLPVEGAVITINGKETEYKTDAEGKVKVKVEDAGKNIISAKSDSIKLVSPVFVANVKGEETTSTEPAATTSEAETSTTASTSASASTTKATSSTAKSSTTAAAAPKTGDAGAGIAVTAVGIAFVAAFAARRKNED